MSIRPIILIYLALPLTVAAQNIGDDFDAFRRNALAGYDAFRKKALDDYDTYLAGVWKDYEAFSGRKRQFGPKPVAPPRYEPQTPATPTRPVAPEKPVMPTIPTIPATPTPPAVPAIPAEPTVPPMPAAPKTISLNFYGAALNLPAEDLPAISVGGPQDAAQGWRGWKAAGMARLAAQLRQEGRRAGLSDWAIIVLASKYLNRTMPQASASTQISALHFLATNMGYDVRLASAGGQLRLLVPYVQDVYEQSYLTLSGKKYYLWPAISGDVSVRTCSLPDGTDAGHGVDLRFGGNLHLGGATKAFKLTGAGLTVDGEVEVAAMRLADDYPSVSIPSCAASVLSRPVRDAIVEKLRQGVSGLGEQEAANRLLHFCQQCFDYATDDEQFGREKYFYFEESLYYPKNDCEDRAIFFAWLVRQILRLDVHLIHYPGHECTAVAFTKPLRGNSYSMDGKTFYICDPTFIGADIGVCMPQFKATSPEVERW